MGWVYERLKFNTMKINPTDLRIGNLVKWQGEVYPICLVSQDLIKIDLGYEAVQRFERDPIYSPNISELEAIELTEDWLYKAGFEKHGRDDIPTTVSFKLNEITIAPLSTNELGNGFGFLWHKTEQNNPSSWKPKFYLWCVQDLQNLFSLTQTELIFK